MKEEIMNIEYFQQNIKFQESSARKKVGKTFSQNRIDKKTAEKLHK